MPVPGLDPGIGPGIHDSAWQVEPMRGLLAREDAKAWMAGPSPAMTTEGSVEIVTDAGPPTPFAKAVSPVRKRSATQSCRNGRPVRLLRESPCGALRNDLASPL